MRRIVIALVLALASISTRAVVTYVPESRGIVLVDSVPSLAAGACTYGTSPAQMVRSTGAIYVCIDNGASDAYVLKNESGGGGTPAGSPADVQVNVSNAFGTVTGFTANTATGEVGTKLLNNARIASKYATGGTGASGTPWTGWESALASDTVLRFPAGRYEVPNSSPTIPTGAKIFCDRGAIFQFRTDKPLDSTPMFLVAAGAASVTIDGCEFYAGQAITTAGLGAGQGNAYVLVGTVDGAAVTDLRITNNDFGPAHISSTTGMSVFVRSPTTGFFFSGNTLDFAIAGLGFSNSSTAVPVHKDVSIVDNTWNYFDFQSGPNMGYALQFDVNAVAFVTRFERMTITSNRFYNVNGVMGGASGGENWVVADNVAKGADLDGFFGNSPASGVYIDTLAITGNTCIGDLTVRDGIDPDLGSCQIKVARARGATVVGNTLYGVHQSTAIDLANTIDFVVASNQVTKDNPDFLIDDACYYIQGDTGNFNGIVEGNLCVDPGDNGFRILQGPHTRVAIRNNLVIGSQAAPVVTRAYDFESPTFVDSEFTGNRYEGQAPTIGVHNAPATELIQWGNSATAGDLDWRLAQGAWDTGHLVIGSSHLWQRSAGRLHVKSSTPGSSTDGNELVRGPASATDNALARWDLTTGGLLQNSTGATCDDSGNITATSFVGPLTGNASTATILAANGGNCTAGQSAGGVSAAGVAEDCLDPIVSTEIDTSAEVAAIVGDETGTGALVFGTGPTITSPLTVSGGADNTRGVELTDNSATCADPASGNTSICTIAGEPYTRDTGGTTREILSTAGGDYGDVSCAAGSCTLDAGTVATNELDETDAYQFSSSTLRAKYLNGDFYCAFDWDGDASVTDDAGDLVACLDAAKTYVGNAENGTDKAARIYLPAGTFALCGATTCPYALRSGMQIHGVAGRITQETAGNPPDADSTPNGGTWIDCGGTSNVCFDADVVRGAALVDVAFKNFGTILTAGTDDVEGMSFSRIENIQAEGSTAPGAGPVQRGFDLYNFQKLHVQNVKIIGVDTCFRLTQQKLEWGGFDSSFSDIYCASYRTGTPTDPMIHVRTLGEAATSNTAPGIWTYWEHVHLAFRATGGTTGVRAFSLDNSSATANGGIVMHSVRDIGVEGNADAAVELLRANHNVIETRTCQSAQTYHVKMDANSTGNTVYTACDLSKILSQHYTNAIFGVANSMTTSNYWSGIVAVAGEGRSTMQAGQASLVGEYLNVDGANEYNQLGILSAGITSDDTTASNDPDYNGVKVSSPLTLNIANARWDQVRGAYFNPQTQSSATGFLISQLLGVEAYPQAGTTGTGSTYSRIEAGRFGANLAATNTTFTNVNIVNALGADGSGSAVTNYAGVNVGNQACNTSNRGTTRCDAIYIESQSNTASVDEGNVRFAGGDFDTGHLRLGSGHAWFDDTNNRFRMKEGTPTSQTDGNAFVVGTGSTSHGVLKWADAVDAFDTGTEVCAASGLTCQDVKSVAGVDSDCATDQGTTGTVFYALCY